MSLVPSIITQRWKSGQLTGDAQHVLVVRIRPGYMDHGYLDTSRIDNGSPIYPPLIWKGNNHSCWKGTWVPTGDWITLPNIQSAHWIRSFVDKGTSSCTIVMDNVEFASITGAGGLFHSIERGWFSPMRGVRATSRPSLWASTGWGNVLNGGFQVELWEGYGIGASVVPLAEPDIVTHSCAPPDAAITRTWTGIIEDCEDESFPDHITITARCFGVMFTDQRVMGWSKAKEIRAPVTFADRKRTQGEGEITGPYHISGGGCLGKGDWLSSGTTASGDAQHIEIDLPAGYYEEFFFSPRYDGEDMYLSLYLGHAGGTQDRVHAFAGDAWVDLGMGSAPGGGPPYMRKWRNTPDQGRRWYLGHGWNVPVGSKLRITMTNLQHDLSWQGDGATAADRLFFAGCFGFWAYRYGNDPAHPPDGAVGVNAKHWILTNDAADVIRMVLIWCGFQEWHVEDFGWTLVNPKVYGEDKFFIDIIDDMLAQGNFTFYMDGPTDDDRSIGVPHFEYQTATDRPRAGMLEVRDTNTIEAATVKWDMSGLPFVMRYRGEVNNTKAGHTLEADLVKRYQATYYPPWTGAGWDTPGIKKNVGTARTGGVRRHFTATLGAATTIGLASDDECLFACVLAAVQYALAECTGQFQTAGYNGFQLNRQCSVIDKGAGINSRMWVASIESSHTLGPQGEWKLIVGGAYLDTEDMTLIARDHLAAYTLMRRRRPPPDEGHAPAYPNPPQLGPDLTARGG